MTPDEVPVLWAYTRGRWPNFTVPTDARVRKAMVQAWMDDLGDLDREDIRVAIAAVSSRDFPPPTGTIRDKVFELLAIARGQHRIPDVDEAWGEVMAQLRSGGRWSRRVFTHPLIEDTVATFGWSNICQSNNLDVLRGQFSRMYDTARRRALEQATPPAPAVARYHKAAEALPKTITELPRSKSGHER